VRGFCGLCKVDASMKLGRIASITKVFAEEGLGYCPTLDP
jgi:hypothetical protein